MEIMKLEKKILKFFFGIFKNLKKLIFPFFFYKKEDPKKFVFFFKILLVSKPIFLKKSMKEIEKFSTLN